MKQNIYDNNEFFEQYAALRRSGITYNDFVEQPAIKSVITGLEGKSILELGCGGGGFAKYCIENGAADVLAMDISRNMINQAMKENTHESITYKCMPMEDLHVISQSFDLIVSSLAVHYIEDYTQLIKQISRLLNVGGEFIFSTEHPMVTARRENNSWIKDEEGNKLHWAIDHYHEEGERRTFWNVDGVIKYHRTLSTLINTLIDNGLTLEKMIEPQSTPEGLIQKPDLINEARKPSFIIFKASKKA